MYRAPRNLTGNLTALCLLLAALACGPSGPSEEEIKASRVAELTPVEQAKTALDQKRQQLAELQGKITAGAPDAQTGETVEQMNVRAEALAMEIEDGAQRLSEQVVELINKYPPVEGEPLDEFQQRAIRMKVNEDLLLAQEWIDKGGDYKRALSILEALQPLDPSNEQLNAAIKRASDMRFMTADRFALVKTGMTEAEVRAVLGQVNLRNIRPFEDKGVVLWLYPREDGAAAGVYFRKGAGGESRVYSLDFNATKKGEQG